MYFFYYKNKNVKRMTRASLSAFDSAASSAVSDSSHLDFKYFDDVVNDITWELKLWPWFKILETHLRLFILFYNSHKVRSFGDGGRSIGSTTLSKIYFIFRVLKGGNISRSQWKKNISKRLSMK